MTASFRRLVFPATPKGIPAVMAITSPILRTDHTDALAIERRDDLSLSIPAHDTSAD
jgi:hypothetical protein